MHSEFSLTHEELAALAPAKNIRHGAGTRGESIAVTMQDLRAEDAATVAALYAFLGGLFERVAPRVDDGLAAIPELRAYLEEARWSELSPRIFAIGSGLDARTVSPSVRKALHDIRGGGLPALVMHIDALLAEEYEPDDVARIFVLCRDQRKIVRNAVPDLDPVGHARDLEPRAHTTELLNKWSTATYRVGDRAVELHLDCEFDGAISECCMEFAALDRVVYNLVNNAARFATDGHVALSVIPIRPDVETDLRFVVANRIDPSQRDRIADGLGGELSRVFQGGYTTGGTGLGLRICADLVCHGYGLESLRLAVEHGYLGARVVGDRFVVWFHWPARRTAA